MTPVPEDSPVMVAWRRWEKTEEFENIRRWALQEHVRSALWAAFLEGFEAARRG